MKQQQIISSILVTNAGMKGLAIFKYWIGRRRFYRRSITGLEGFKSYEQMRLIRFIEWLGVIFANLLIMGGILLFLLCLIPPYGHHK
ncbi:hypothetical protein AB6735_16765 [Mucilaginibacter sp. RCC_168]|uniref:hypothetical protein n=1 Tax=Mucilaginibacter sp. RCC_168 TaxID=3239221 RepID=UPI0008819807|nr:hypothetical protein SAMN05428975_0411 [Mucilaginibacter sp. OK268]